MRKRALLLALLIPLAGCGEGSGRPQPLMARAVCAVERWLGQADYRRREPGSGFCDAEGLRMPTLPSPDPPEEPEEPAD